MRPRAAGRKARGDDLLDERILRLAFYALPKIT
jgi:hypothetical protein